MTEKFLDAYQGQTTEQLLALEGEYRLDSLVLAFEQAIQQIGDGRPLSVEEQYVLAVEGLEREVNNGGYSQFFLNSSHEFVGVIELACLAIGCPKTARITRDAIRALNLDGAATPEAVEAVVLADDPAVLERLGRCDDEYFANDEAIADRLFAWIKENAGAIRVSGA